MNERIKELFVRAYGYVPLPIEDHISPEMEKFAELIVRECASRVDNILRERKDGGGTIGDEIREHFGVELWTNELNRLL